MVDVWLVNVSWLLDNVVISSSMVSLLIHSESLSFLCSSSFLLISALRLAISKASLLWKFVLKITYKAFLNSLTYE